MKTAIVFFVYNRLNHTQYTLQKILEYRDNSPIFIFSDGPKKSSNEKEVVELREYIKSTTKGESEISIHESVKNKGLANSVIHGINYVIKNGFERFIVLEDDCKPEESFFRDTIYLLDNYENNDNVYHITGFGLPFQRKYSNNDNYFTPYPGSWGWASWSKYWIECDFNDIEFYEKILSDKSLLNKFNEAGKSYSVFLSKQLKGEVDSWLIRWYVHIFKNNGLCSWFYNSRIYNLGFDGTGVHKMTFDRFNTENKLKEGDELKIEDNFNCNHDLIIEFKQHFMGDKVIDKIKSLIYLKTGIIIDKLLKK